METKHTPGPWRYQVNADAYTHIVRDSDNKYIAGCGQRTTGEDEANARLIAAAPELLEALRGVVLLFDDCRAGCLLLARADHEPMTNGDQEVIDKAFIAVEGAIRKAKGE